MGITVMTTIDTKSTTHLFIYSPPQKILLNHAEWRAFFQELHTYFDIPFYSQKRLLSIPVKHFAIYPHFMPYFGSFDKQGN